MDKRTFIARYENTGSIAIAIVASASYWEGELFDWAAYIGGTTDTWSEEAAIKTALDYGNKLRAEDAQYYFPDLPIERYRP